LQRITHGFRVTTTLQINADNSEELFISTFTLLLGYVLKRALNQAFQSGTKKICQVLGVFGLLDFTMLRPVLALRAF
jgi:hypothetical protein